MRDEACEAGGLEVLPYLALIFWFFCGTFVVCEKYFVPSLETLGSRLGMSEDVQGATLMAIGSSLPELFTALIGLFLFEKENPGPATNVGSAIFNTSVIMGACAITSRSGKLSIKPFLRDSVFYFLSLALLFISCAVTTPDKISALESTNMLLLYVFYVAVLGCFSWKTDDSSVREIEFSVLGTDDSKDDGTKIEESGEDAFDTNSNIVIDHSISHSSTHDSRNDSSATGCVFNYLMVPFEYLFLFTIPKVNDDRAPEKAYRGALMMSICWIGILTWLVVFLSEKVADCVGVDANLTGVTVLAVGSSLPDMFSSVIVAREGKLGMAVANALGT